MGHAQQRVAVFGDVGGHREEWWDRLAALGCDPDTLALPDGLSVVQLGDLVHRGPDSSGCLRLAGALWEANPGRVRLLVGNHEGCYLDGPRFGMPGGGTLERLGDADAELLVRWWGEGRLTAAAAIVGADGHGTLVTHAGLTRGCWETLGHPSDVEAAAEALQLLWVWSPAQFWRAGRMLAGPVDTSAGPVWAEAGSELYESWRGASGPFDQVHGHTSAYHWGRDTWSPEWVGTIASRDRVGRHVHAHLGGRVLHGIDPCLGAWGGVRWEPLVLPGRLA